MSIVTNGIILAVYCFIIFTIYIFVSSPFDQMMTGFQDVNLSESDSHIEESASLGRTVFDMIFGGMILIPVIYFVYTVFVREPDWRFKQ